ncbi:rab-GTPase-TBC domain-containing protein [Ditylenchus destructor]|uniref:Rab-GTPase-TBC domain-containing protein n=1 Tax=Ditylenchus destructor TaxID=166010 RepID=A0AAD4R6S2_9BILA|nr:rab-GTPase-TBC domain-containing protein [Ditylenchus destructor]
MARQTFSARFNSLLSNFQNLDIINEMENHKASVSSTFSELFKKAHGALAQLRGGSNFFLGKSGEIIYSKNNVCVHEALNNANISATTSEPDPAIDENMAHMPGYLTITCQNDEQSGVTLVLQWLPNATLEKNPASIRCVSPRNHHRKESLKIENESNENGKTDREVKSKTSDENDKNKPADSGCIGITDTCVEIGPEGETMRERVGTENNRPQTLGKNRSMPCGDPCSSGLGIPSINLIPNTPMDHGSSLREDEPNLMKRSDSSDTSATSGADEASDRDEDLQGSSSCEDEEEQHAKALNMANYRKSCENMISSIPEQFAKEHNLMYDNSKVTDDTENGTATLAMLSKERVVFQQKPTSSNSLFSVNLGKMRSMRIFYSNPECTSGQLVIASPDSQYKILHFHYGGLDKLAQLFEHWNVVKAKSFQDGSPSPLPDRHLLICHPEISRTELDPEDGLYERVSWEFWKSYKNEDGSIDDVFQAVYFASMDPSLRKELWPFLLRVYPWTSTLEQREAIRNDLFLGYQKIKRVRIKRMSVSNVKSSTNLLSIESTITKDVVRTDRKNPFFSGENNPNLETMKSILLNYASAFPEVGYIQGMSDLLSPLLITFDGDETNTYWCFVNLMQQTLFCSSPATESRNVMEINLEYLSLGGDAPNLMFVHRWILLFFKREFPEADALHLWEACWSRYRTAYFHLFVSAAIVSIYGPDIIAQKLPHDEILLYFSSLAMHMDADVVLKKARGLLYNFYRLPKIPCTLAGLCDLDSTSEQWSSAAPQHQFECTKGHDENEPCPYASVS